MVYVFFSLALFIEYTFIEICTYIWCFLNFFYYPKGPGGSLSQVVGLPNNSYKTITNMAWVRTQLCKLQKGCTRLAAASDTIYQLLAHGRWFSHSTKASSTTKTGRHDIAEILLKVVLSTKDQSIYYPDHFLHCLNPTIGLPVPVKHVIPHFLYFYANCPM